MLVYRYVCSPQFAQFNNDSTFYQSFRTFYLTFNKVTRVAKVPEHLMNTSLALELCDTIDTTRYRDTKWVLITLNFGIIGIDYAT